MRHYRQQKTILIILLGLLTWISGNNIYAFAQVDLTYEQLCDTPYKHIAVIEYEPIQTDPSPIPDTWRLLRTYPSAKEYVAEANLPFITADSNIASLSGYEIDPSFCANLMEGGNIFFDSISVITDSLEWLNYVPRQVIVSGDCGRLSQLPLIPLRERETSFISDAYCMNVFDSGSEETVLQVVERLTSEYGDVLDISPNWLTYAADPDMGTIVGSPAAQHYNAPQPSWAISSGGGEAFVTVFDSYPLELSVGMEDFIPITLPFSPTVMTRDVYVTYPYPLQDSYLPTSTYNIMHSVASHGTIVATQLLREAPDASAKIVRVLNDYGYGTLDVWMKAMIDEAYNGQNGLMNIFNSSLIVADTPITLSDGTIMINTAQTLETLLTVIGEQGIIQVAAAGNNSYNITTHLPQPLPGRHPDVIGVAATAGNAPSGHLSCYSDIGDIAWIGGGLPKSSNPTCVPKQIVDDCANVANKANDCIIGYDPLSPSRYSWAIGSSFASPRIAGIIARQCLGMSNSSDIIACLGGAGLGIAPLSSASTGSNVGNLYTTPISLPLNNNQILSFIVTNPNPVTTSIPYNITTSGNPAMAVSFPPFSSARSRPITHNTLLTGSVELAPYHSVSIPLTVTWHDSMVLIDEEIVLSANINGVKESSVITVQSDPTTPVIYFDPSYDTGFVFLGLHEPLLEPVEWQIKNEFEEVVYRDTTILIQDEMNPTADFNRYIYTVDFTNFIQNSEGGRYYTIEVDGTNWGFGTVRSASFYVDGSLPTSSTFSTLTQRSNHDHQMIIVIFVLITLTNMTAIVQKKQR